MAKVWLIFFDVLNSPIVICLGCQSNPKKLIKSKNIMCPLRHPLVKLVVANNVPILIKTNICFVFSTNLNNISWKHCFIKGKTTWRHRCKIGCLNQILSKKLQWQLIFHNKKIKVLQKVFLLFIILLKGIFDRKKLRYCTSWNIHSFFCKVSFN